MIIKGTNLVFLLNEQAQLDHTILKKKSLTRKETRKKREVAFLIELSEFVNDTQYFKYWKENNQHKDTMLEEFIDSLHFALSLAIDSDENLENIEKKVFSHYLRMKDQVKEMSVDELLITLYQLPSTTAIHDSHLYLSYLLLLAMRFQFTELHLLEEYRSKNKVNYERQQNGY